MMKVAVISIYTFPLGMAATNRIAAYTQGLAENGADVTVLIPAPAEPFDSKSILPDVGEYNGVEYRHLSGRKRNRNKIIRGIASLSGIRNLIGAVKSFKWLSRNRPDFVIISNDEPAYLRLYNRICRFLRIKTIFIFDEYPTPIRHYLKTDIPEKKKKQYRKILPHFSAYISITKKLQDFYNGFAVKPCFLMPVIVNTSRFENIPLSPKKCISYIGNMDLTKDSVDDIIKAFSRIVSDNPELTLRLYGNPDDKSKETIVRLIEELGLQNKALLMGRIPSDEVPKAISESMIMVSAQPDTRRAEGGFPTKLGEYLAMGVPTVMSDVGENSQYVTERDCYFVDPGNIKDYANTLSGIIANYETSLKRAANGKKTVRVNYSHHAIGKKLLMFLNGLE